MATCVIGRFALRRVCSVANVAKKAHTWKHVRTFSISSRILARRCIFNFFYRLSGNCWKMLQWHANPTQVKYLVRVPLSPRISCTWRSQYGSPVLGDHNTGILVLCTIPQGLGASEKRKKNYIILQGGELACFHFFKSSC